MTAIDASTRVALDVRPSGFVQDTVSIAGRALRAVPRDLTSVIPPVFIAIFFFLVNIGTLENLTEATAGSGFDYRAFQLATAILLGVTGVSRATVFVLDVQNGYFDRLLVTPVSRLAILVGHLVADVAVAAGLILPVMGFGMVFGVRFATGVLGAVLFVILGSLWSLAFAAFGYAFALRTGNPAAVQSSFLLFFPFLFLTSSYVPREALTGWLDAVATANPVTYLLEGLRALVMRGWVWSEIGAAFLAVAIVATISLSMSLAALRGRVERG